MTTLHPEVTRFLSAQPLKMYIGGRWVDAQSGKTFETLDPGEGAVLAKIAAGESADAVWRTRSVAGELDRVDAACRRGRGRAGE